MTGDTKERISETALFDEEITPVENQFQDGRPSGHTGPDAGRDPEGICQGRR